MKCYFCPVTMCKEEGENRPGVGGLTRSYHFWVPGKDSEGQQALAENTQCRFCVKFLMPSGGGNISL